MTHKGSREADDETGVASDDIEVTPAMIEAGVLAFASVDLRVDTNEEIVVDIFRAMMAARANIGVMGQDD